MMTDDEVKAAMARAGILAPYRSKARRLADVDTTGVVAGWVKETVVAVKTANAAHETRVDGVPSAFVWGSLEATDAFFLAARGLLLSGLSVQILGLPELFWMDYVDMPDTRKIDVTCLWYIGAKGAPVGGPSNKLPTMELWLSNALRAGRVFLFQGCEGSAGKNPWFTADMNELLASRCRAFKIQGAAR